MSIPKGDEVEAQAQSAGATPSAVPAPCPSGDVPKEGSRDIQQKGKIISVPHDWCKSTDSPVPYKIWAWQSPSSNLANSVRQTDCRSHVLGSTVNQCFGDEPGTGGGVKSGTNLAECTPLSASPTVRAENRPMVRYLDKWWMNHGNTWGCLNNSEDMGKYDPPKLQQIDAKLSPIPSREEDQASAASGTKVAQADVIVEEGGQLVSPVLAGSAAAAGVVAGNLRNLPRGLGPTTSHSVVTDGAMFIVEHAAEWLRVSMAKFPPGYIRGDKGAEEWGRRNGIGKDAGRRIFHGIKQGDNISTATDDYGVNPDTGDVVDPEGEVIGNMGE